MTNRGLILFLVHLSRRLKCTFKITRCPWSVHLSSLCIYIFDFSETAEQNSKKFDRKQDRNDFYLASEICDVRAHRKITNKRMPPWSLICGDIFDFSLETTEWNLTKLNRQQECRIMDFIGIWRTVLYQVLCFSCW